MVIWIGPARRRLRYSDCRCAALREIYFRLTTRSLVCLLTIRARPSRARVSLTFEHLTSFHMIRRSILWYRAPVEHLDDKWRNSAVFG